MEDDFIAKNKSEYLRLKNILDNLSQDNWQQKIVNDWNIGNSLLHLAFWDKMTFERLSTWKKNGKLAPIPDTETIDAINATLRAFCNNMDLDNSYSFILHSAEEIDNMVSQFNSDELDKLKNSGKERWFKRYMHRSEHLNKIELYPPRVLTR